MGRMDMTRRLLAAGLLSGCVAAQAATIDLAGSDGTGGLSASNFKVWTSRAEAEASEFPFWQDGNFYRTIASVPLSADTTYYEESLGYTVENKKNTQADFAVFSAGQIVYDDSALTGSGVETIAAGTLSFQFNNDGFSPALSVYNTGGGLGNYPFYVSITASNILGNGLTFTDGVLTSVDLTADISIALSVSVAVGDNTYDGSLSISGNQYAFAVNVLQDNVFRYEDCELVPGMCIPLAVPSSNNRVVLDRAGSIAAVVPEPGTYALMGGGLLLVGVVARRRRG